jgi:hypothetical protein
MVEIHESVCRPQALLQLLPGDDPAVMLQQGGQNLKGLLLQPNSPACNRLQLRRREAR